MSLATRSTSGSRHRSERDDLRDTVLAVFFRHVRNHFVAPLDAEIGIDVGHRDAVRIEESFEEQIEPDRIEVGDLQRVGDQRSDCGAAPRSDRNVVIARVFDEIPDDEEVRGKAHLGDDVELVLQARAQRRLAGHALRAVTREQALFADPPQVFVIVDLADRRLRHRILRKVEDFLGNPNIDAIGNARGVLASFGKVAPQLVHLLRRLHVKLIGVELHAAGIGDGFPGTDAEQHVVGGSVFLFEVVRVVGCDDREGKLARDLHETLVDDAFLGHPVAHYFDVEAIAEDVDVGFSVLERRRVVVLEQGRGDQAGHAAREHDQPVVVLLEQIEIDPGLVIVALQKALGDQGGQVAVADQVGGQQRDVRLLADGPVEPAPGRDIRLAADDGRQARLPGGVVKLHRPVHDAVVGEGHRGGAVLGRPAAEPVDPAGPIEQ
jgi:hypothetical protein